MARTGGGVGAGVLRCAVCGERISRARTPGRFTHKARLVASCDLDGDHPAVPDAVALGRVPCRRCGAPTVLSGTGFTHDDPERDADHPADPELPLA